MVNNGKNIVPGENLQHWNPLKDETASRETWMIDESQKVVLLCSSLAAGCVFSKQEDTLNVLELYLFVCLFVCLAIS